jgi:DNA-binding GntR family transcriptional regulator
MNKPERLRATDLAYGAIRQDLLAGRWPAGAHLRETELAAVIGVSRTPVREALRQLASEGLLLFEPHLGARVPGWSEQDLEEIFALRIELEGYAAGAAARNATPEQVETLRQLARDMEGAAFAVSPPDYVRITEVNDRFHGLIVEAAGNRRLATMVATIVELPLIVRTFARFDAHAMRRSVGHHFDLVEAIAKGDAQWATAVMRAHIHAGRQVMCGRPAD